MQSVPAKTVILTVVPQGLLLAEALSAVGVDVRRVTVAVRNPDVGQQQRRLLHTISSAPMRDILRDCMQPSDNLYAECLLRMLAPNPPSGLSSGASISAAQAQLSQAIAAVRCAAD